MDVINPRAKPLPLSWFKNDQHFLNYRNYVLESTIRKRCNFFSFVYYFARGTCYAHCVCRSVYYIRVYICITKYKQCKHIFQYLRFCIFNDLVDHSMQICIYSCEIAQYFRNQNEYSKMAFLAFKPQSIFLSPCTTSLIFRTYWVWSQTWPLM